MDTFILAAIAAMILWGFGDFFLSKAVRKVGIFLPLVFIGFIGAVIFAPKSIPLLAHLTGYNWLLLIVVGLLHLGMDYFLFEGFRKGKLSVIIVLFQLELPFTIVLASTVLSEKITFAMIILFTLLVLGSTLLSKAYKIKIAQFEKGWWWAIVGALFCALVNTTTAIAAKEISPLLAIWFSWVIVFLSSMIFLWNELDVVIKNAKSYFKILIVVALFQVAAWLSFSYALSGKNLSIVAGITAGYCVITALLGYWINEDKLNNWQVFGALITIMASIILATVVG